jgi:PAS domain S-box-containing protein
MSQDQFDKDAHVLFELANQISTMAYQNVQQARVIAERDRAEETLRKYEQIVSASQDVMALINADYTYATVNESFLKSRNKSRRDVVGRTVAEVMGEEVFHEKIKPHLERAFSGQTVRNLETFDRFSGECEIVEVTLFPILDKKGKAVGVVLNARDITETRKLEEQLIQSQKIESIGTLASGVAHEINNPINGIMNYAQMIKDRLEKGRQADGLAEEIIHETQRIATIVRNLLTFSRQEKQSHSPAHLSDIVSSVLSLVQTVMRRDQIDLQVDIPSDLPQFKCRSQEIQQVLMNLLTNARDALNEMYEGYNPEKRLRVIGSLIVTESRRFVRMTVEDTGAGIKQEIIDRIFDPFFTTKSKDVGTGLGLSISYGIIRNHGGELRVESIPGSYTRFYVDLPVDNGWEL